MNGNLEYELKFQNKIDKLLDENKNLMGFYYFIGEQSISTRYNYLLNIISFLTYADKSPGQLILDDFAGYMMKIQKNKYGEKTTSSYKIAVYSSLKKYGKYLVASGHLDRNPMDFIDRPKNIETKETKDKREKGYLSKKEINRYISTVEVGAGSERSTNRQKEWKERDLAIIMIFLNTGIRCSALMKMDLDSVDFVNKKINVIDKGSSYNSYDVTDELLEIIDNWLTKREELLNGKQENALFISNRRKRISQDGIDNIVKKYAVNIKGKNISPHKLRATYGTQLYESTKDIYFVQQCMSHKSVNTTQRYIRGNVNRTKKASDIMKELTIDKKIKFY